MNLMDSIRSYWDEDAATYDLAPQHRPRSSLVQAAWTAALERALPPAPSRVLDAGAGTGFLSLVAARLGHQVTAVDLSPAMLERLRSAASDEDLPIEIVEGSADDPVGTFDAVMERHLLWTLPDPAAALRAWRAAAPSGRLVLVESLSIGVDPVERARSRVRHRLAAWRGSASEHHAQYDPSVRAQLPLGSGISPSHLVDLAVAAGWSEPRLTRLRDVEWAERIEMPWPERLVGMSPRYTLTAGR